MKAESIKVEKKKTKQQKSMQEFSTGEFFVSHSLPFIKEMPTQMLSILVSMGLDLIGLTKCVVRIPADVYENSCMLTTLFLSEFLVF